MEGFWKIHQQQEEKPLRYEFRFAPIDTPKTEPPKEFTFLSRRMEDEIHLRAIKEGLLYQLKANFTK